MKTKILFAIPMMFLLLTGAMAETGATTDLARPTDAATFLEKNINYPIVARTYNITGSVFFKLTVNEESQLQYEFLAWNSELLAKSVENQVKKLEPKLAELIEPGTTQTFKLKFDTP